MTHDPKHARPDEIEEMPEDQHLEVAPYEDTDRVEAPDWYDDTINVGDEANKEATA
jgi:hypothetical protein